MCFLNVPLIRFYAGFIRCRFWLGCVGGVFLMAGCVTPHRNPAVTEARAAYVCSFGEFVEWPAAVFANPKVPFVIGIYGAGDLDGELPSLAQARRINGRKVVICPIQSEAEITRCQILFVSGFQRHFLPGIVARLKNASVLTVSEDLDDFAASGVMINLFEAGGKKMFEINLAAANRAGLKISSKLLALAQPLP
jgi:YfiR/HmsC-like